MGRRWHASCPCPEEVPHKVSMAVPGVSSGRTDSGLSPCRATGRMGGLGGHPVSSVGRRGGLPARQRGRKDAGGPGDRRATGPGGTDAPHGSRVAPHSVGDAAPARQRQGSASPPRVLPQVRRATRGLRAAGNFVAALHTGSEVDLQLNRPGALALALTLALGAPLALALVVTFLLAVFVAAHDLLQKIHDHLQQLLQHVLHLRLA